MTAAPRTAPTTPTKPHTAVLAKLRFPTAPEALEVVAAAEEAATLEDAATDEDEATAEEAEEAIELAAVLEARSEAVLIEVEAVEAAETTEEGMTEETVPLAV